MNPPRTSTSVRLAAPPELVCESCGAPGAERIGGRLLCVPCYAERGSCCIECEPEDDPLVKATQRDQ